MPMTVAFTALAICCDVKQLRPVGDGDPHELVVEVEARLSVPASPLGMIGVLPIPLADPAAQPDPVAAPDVHRTHHGSAALAGSDGYAHPTDTVSP